MVSRKTLSFIMLAICAVSALGSIALYVLMPEANERYLLLVMRSGSMEPAIMRGSTISVDKSASADDIAAAPYPDGDIICFRSTYSDEYIVHRAINRTVQDGEVTAFIAHGDRNPVGFNENVPVDNLVGKVVDTNVMRLTVALLSLIATAVTTGLLSMAFYNAYRIANTTSPPTAGMTRFARAR